MRTASHEDLGRQEGTVPPLGHRRSPPIPVVLGVVGLVTAVAWMELLTPPVAPTLTVEFPISLSSLLLGGALVIGTLLGVRLLWGITLFLSVPPRRSCLGPRSTIRLHSRSAA